MDPSTLELVTDIELRHLAAMAAIAEEGSFGRAAARLGYTQSTVSQQIAALERAVGGQVFDRPGGPKPVRITPLGAVVLEHGRDLLTKADRLAEAVDRFKAGDGRIDIGTFQSVSNVILPGVVRRLRDEHPGCDIRLFEEEPEQPRIGDLDLLFYDGRIEGDVEHLKLLDDPYLLVARDGAFPDGPVQLKQLDGAPMVAWPLTCDQPSMEQALTRGGIRPRTVFRTAINDTLLSMVRAGMGSAVLPWLAIRGAEVQSDHRLRVHELRPSPPARELYLHRRAGRTQSPLAARAIEIAVEVAREIAEPPAKASAHPVFHTSG
jgi:DNA-binding transcriptional LysR family regulator